MQQPKSAKTTGPKEYVNAKGIYNQIICHLLPPLSQLFDILYRKSMKVGPSFFRSRVMHRRNRTAGSLPLLSLGVLLSQIVQPRRRLNAPLSHVLASIERQDTGKNFDFIPPHLLTPNYHLCRIRVLLSIHMSVPIQLHQNPSFAAMRPYARH